MAEEPKDALEPDSPSETPSGSAVVRERFFVDGSKPLPQFSSPNAKAFLAEDRHDLSRALFALVCTPGTPIRLGNISKIRENPGRGVLEIVESEVVHWPAVSQKTMIIIFAQPQGGRVVDEIKSGSSRLTEYDIPRRVISPIVDAIRHMNSIGVTHRAIRPDNVFFLDENKEEIVVGECITTPPGYDQPSIFEPLERAMAPPAGRGDGGISDDLYALGATLVILTLGQNPVERMSNEDLLFRRMTMGSYAAICGNARVPIPLLEPLRGLLSDEHDERWGLEQIDQWLNGRKQTPMQKKAAKKSETPFRFGGQDHTNVRTLAHAFNRQVSDAAKILEDETFHAWLRRAAGEQELSETLKGFIDNAKFHKDSFQGSEEHLVSRCCAAMDPHGPIRYKGITVCVDGFGPMLAIEMIRDGNVQTLAEIISKDIFQFWTGERSAFVDLLDTARDFVQMKQWLSINEPGYGLQRCLYELNSGLPCQSTLILEQAVFSVRELLPALDDASNQSDANARPMDRHIAAFIASRFNEDINPHLRALAAQRESTSIIGMLSLLAFLQWKLRIAPVYGLASWMGGLLGPAINSYHSRSTRRDLEREIPKLVRRGSLPDLFDMIDNAERRQEDQDGYADALEEYSACMTEIQEIEGAGSELIENAERTGQKSAAMVSVLTTMIAVSIIFINQML